jgi:serine/threonine protein kinase
MSITEYSKVLEKTELTFDGNNLTTPCKDLLKGLLEKNINKRMSFEEVFYHPWTVLIQDKIDDIVSKYNGDPDKMIIELNKVTLKDEYFENKNYINLNTHEYIDGDDSFINKKRKRCKDKTKK